MGANAVIYSGCDGLLAVGHHPLSGVHASFLYLETAVASSLAPSPVRSTIILFLKKRYASIYSPVHVLAFYLDPFVLGCRDASQVSSIKPLH
jgi:hypothetical protein